MNTSKMSTRQDVYAYLQAQEEIAQLQSQLQDAVVHQEALQHALHDMQSTTAVLRDQIQRQAETAADEADCQGVPETSHHPKHNAVHCTPANGLVHVLQQQVRDLKRLSAVLADAVQLQHEQEQPWQHHAAASAGLLNSSSHSRALKDTYPCLPQGSPGMAGGSWGLSASQPALKHDCKMPPPPSRSMLSRRLPMSAYASPASLSPSRLTDAIKAHHHVHQSAAEAPTGDKCWCGRPRKLAGSAVSTPSRHGVGKRVDSSSSASRRHNTVMASHTATPTRAAGR